jgi:hypothetical protein
MLFDQPIVALYLLLFLEYILIAAWLTYKLIKYCRNHYKLPSQVFTFCAFAVLFSVTRVSLVFLMIFRENRFIIGVIMSLGFLFRFSGISEITRYWYYTYRCAISTMNRLEICPYELGNTIRHQKLGYLVGNILVYVLFIVLAVVYGLGYIHDVKNDYAMPWAFRIYQVFLSVLMLICLYVSGYRLIHIVNTYCTRRPTKLMVNMNIALIAYFYETVIAVLTVISPTLFGGTDTEWEE